MKNKIRCHFDKINKFIQSEHFIDDVLPLITAAVVIFSIVLCSLLSLMSASAAGYFPQTVTLTNPAGVPYEFIVVCFSSTADSLSTLNTFNDNANCNYPARSIYNEAQIFTVSDGYIDGIEFEQNTIPNGTYYAVYQATVEGENTVFEPTQMPTYFGEFVLDDIYYFFYIDDYTTDNELILAQSTTIEFQASSTIKLVPVENTVPPTQCPTLEEQIAQYSGSWVQFINMVRQNNPALGNSYQNVVNEAIVAGKISVQGDFIHFSGTYDELLQLLMTTSNNNPNIQAVLDQELQRQFDNGVAGGYDDGYSDGKDYGQEIGYKNGYNSGLNKGQSDNALKGFFGNFIGGVIDVVDSIHFYEEFDSNGNLTFYLSPWSIVIVVLMVAIVIIFLKVFRGG